MAPQKKFLFVIFVLVSVSLACGALTPPTPTEPPPPTPTFTPLPPTNTPEPTATLAPTNTPQPTATPMPKPGDVIFSEKFDDTSNRWYTTSNADAAISIADGSYSALVRKASTIYTMQPSFSNNSLSLADVDVTVDVTLKEGNFNNATFGISCRRDESTKNYYVFMLSGDGNYYVAKRFNDAWQTLVQYTYTGVARAGYATNSIRVICAGDTMRLIINNQVLYTVKDDTIKNGRGFALHAANYLDAGIKVTFDNLVVKIAEPINTQIAGGNTTNSTAIPGATTAALLPTSTPAPASTADALKQKLQQLKIVAQSLAAISDGTTRVGGTSGGGFDCGQFVNLYASLSRYPTFDTSGESSNIQQANLKYADAIKRLTKDSKLMNDWCFKWATGEEGKNLTIGYDTWNPAREASNYAFVVINQALDLLK